MQVALELAAPIRISLESFPGIARRVLISAASVSIILSHAGEPDSDRQRHSLKRLPADKGGTNGRDDDRGTDALSSACPVGDKFKYSAARSGCIHLQAVLSSFLLF